MKCVLAMLLLCCLCACSSVTVRTDDERKTRTSPDYEQRFNYFWWGVKGTNSVNVREVCKGDNVEQMQAINTFSDSFLTLITLGIYSPRTARVWCKQVKPNA